MQVREATPWWGTGLSALLAGEAAAELREAELKAHGIGLRVEEARHGGVEAHERLAAALAGDFDALRLPAARTVLDHLDEQLDGLAREPVREIGVHDVDHLASHPVAGDLVHDEHVRRRAARLVEVAQHVLDAGDGALVGLLG